MTQSIQTFAMTICSLVLLLVILRCRRFELPNWMKLGAILICAGQLFPLASAVVGTGRINNLLEGRFLEDDESVEYFIDDFNVSHDYYQTLQCFMILEQAGVILVGLGFMKIIRSKIHEHQQSFLHP